MVKVLNRDAINRMVEKNSPIGGSSSNGNVTTANRSSIQQEQTRKGPDMETRLKELEDRVAKLEALHNQK
jgi:hypothetical protein